MGVISSYSYLCYNTFRLLPRYGGYSNIVPKLLAYLTVVSPLWGLFQEENNELKARVSCFPVMGVILNEHNNLTRLEKLELALLDQHE